MSRSKLLTAAHVILYINGKAYAQVTSFHWDSQTPPRAIMGVDSSEPYELAPTISKIHGTVGLLRVIGDGGLEGAGIAPHYADLPRGKYFSLTLVERSSDTQIFRADRCWLTTQGWDIPAKGRVTGQMAFEALDWNNESGH